MTAPTSVERSCQPPATVLAWVSEHAGAVTACRDASSNRPGSRVWELTLADGERCFLKLSPTQKFYRRETAAYRHAVPLLDRAGAPRLLACSDEHRALLLTTAPGTPVPTMALSPEQRWAVHQRAGAALHRYHQHTGPDDQGRVHVRAEADLAPAAGTVERHLEQAGELIGPQWRALVRAHAAQISSLGPLPVAFVHGDWQERNWLWDAGNEHLAVVDFERSRFAPAVSDLVRLAYAGPWGEQPDLQSAFMTGYGRPLSVDEERALPALAAADAASGMAYGREHGDDEVLSRAARTLTLLAELLRADPRDPPSDCVPYTAALLAAVTEDRLFSVHGYAPAQQHASTDPQHTEGGIARW